MSVLMIVLTLNFHALSTDVLDVRVVTTVDKNLLGRHTSVWSDDSIGVWTHDLGVGTDSVIFLVNWSDGSCSFVEEEPLVGSS